jgi:TPR repeat protein
MRRLAACAFAAGVTLALLACERWSETAHLQKACDAGDAEACSKLGQQYYSGKGVKEDRVKAVSLYQKACDGGSATGCFRLGFWHDDSRPRSRATGRGRVKTKVHARSLAQDRIHRRASVVDHGRSIFHSTRSHPTMSSCSETA